MTDPLDSQAAAFAQLLTLSGNPDAAFRSAVALADGLFPHQIEGVAFLLGRRRAILADDMGLGKTRQSIVSLRHLTPGGRRLVVCPASVKQNWAREIALVAADSAVQVIEGSAPPSPTAEWVIINYDILGRHIDHLLARAVGGAGVRRSALPEEPHQRAEQARAPADGGRGRRELGRSPCSS